MAGGKQSPRQKMIGMMYLVLTALLALNVSNAVLEKFAILNNTLHQLRAESEVKNAGTNLRIQEATSSAPKTVDAKKRAVEVRDITTKVLADLDEVVAELSKNSEGEEIPLDELILDTNTAEEKMLDPQKGIAPKFEKIITDYQSKLAEISRIKDLPKLNRKVTDFEEFKKAPELQEHHKEKDFIHFTFEGTPTMASIAVISQLQTEILEMEATVLDTLSKIADVGTMKVDQYAVMVIPESNVVVAGSKYKAKMFVAASSSGLTPAMKRNGADLAVSADGETGLKMANVEFMASASSYGEDNTVEQSYKAEITLKSPDTTLVRTIKYRVAAPVIKVTTGKAPTLYQNCGNLVTIDVPSLGANYNPSFTARGAEVRGGPSKAQPYIIPKDSRIEVFVNSGGLAIGSQKFDTKPIPRPRYGFKNALSRAVVMSGEPSAGLASLFIEAKADENFKNEVPQDATFTVASFEISWWRGTTQMGGKAKVGTNGQVNLADWRPQFKPGDTFEVKLLKVFRTTYLKTQEEVSLAGEMPYIIKIK